jgi:hypothetical protein
MTAAIVEKSSTPHLPCPSRKIQTAMGTRRMMSTTMMSTWLGRSMSAILTGLEMESAIKSAT